jgi:hypothetical protein
MSDNQRRVFRAVLAQRSCVELYPPVLHQARLLADVGDVTIVDSPGPTDPTEIETAGDIDRVRSECRAVGGSVAARAKRMRWLLQFAAAVRRELARKPDVAIAYEAEAAALLLLGLGRSRRTLRIVHMHEVAMPPGQGSLSNDAATRYVHSRLRYADLVTVADAHRARLLADTAGLSTLPTVVMNCPPVLTELPKSRLLPWLRERGISQSRIVHYQGSIGPDHSVLETVLSMRYWPEDSVFVIVGSGSSSYIEQLRAVAAEEGLGERVHLVGRVPYGEVFSYAVGASVGISLLEASTVNWKFSAGASNKRFEYAALALPQVTNEGPGIEDLFVRHGIARAVPAREPEAIGHAIRDVLLDPARSKAMGQRARALHLAEYNYEQQFAPVLERLSERIAARRKVA